MQFHSIDPATGEAFATWDGLDDGGVERVLDAADRAYRIWRKTSLMDRAIALSMLADLLDARAERYGELMAREMGKPVAQGVAEAHKCAVGCRYYAENAEAFLAARQAPSDASRSYVRHDPLGLVLAIMPWNFPFWQVFRFGAPALMAGNGFVLKHAPNTFGCAEAITALFEDSGMPRGLVGNLVVHHDAVARVIADDRIAAVTLTGSERAGRAVASAAGHSLKRSVLELGGSDPFVVLDDADLDRAARAAVQSRLLNSGQSCIAAKRFIVVSKVAHAFLDRFAAGLGEAVVGNPRDARVTVGPVARDDLRDTLHRQVRDSVAAGANLRFGGTIPSGPGFFYPVTLLTNVARGMPAWQEELFGPAAAVRVVPDTDAALAAANDTAYGLGASLWTSSGRGEALAAHIEAGSVFVNGLVKSDPRLPFGGIKRSGYGRELGRLGIHEFVNAKTVWVG